MPLFSKQGSISKLLIATEIRFYGPFLFVTPLAVLHLYANLRSNKPTFIFDCSF